MTSHRRRCDVITSHGRLYNVILRHVPSWDVVETTFPLYHTDNCLTEKSLHPKFRRHTDVGELFWSYFKKGSWVIFSAKASFLIIVRQDPAEGHVLRVERVGRKDWLLSVSASYLVIGRQSLAAGVVEGRCEKMLETFGNGAPYWIVEKQHSPVLAAGAKWMLLAFTYSGLSCLYLSNDK